MEEMARRGPVEMNKEPAPGLDICRFEFLFEVVRQGSGARRDEKRREHAGRDGAMALKVGQQLAQC